MLLIVIFTCKLPNVRLFVIREMSLKIIFVIFSVHLSIGCPYAALLFMVVTHDWNEPSCVADPVD